MATRSEILTQLQRAQDRVLARYQELTDEESARPITDSEIPNSPSWSANDHLAHITAIEHTFQRMIQRAINGHTDPTGGKKLGATREEKVAAINRNNEAIVAAHRDKDRTTLLADYAATRAATLELLAGLSDEQLALPVPNSEFGDNVGELFLTGSDAHADMHLHWIAEALPDPA